MSERPRGLLLAAAAVVIVVGGTAVLAAVGVPAQAYRDRDFFQFWAAPHALFEHASPYDPAWWTAFHAREGSAALLNPPLPAPGAPAWTYPYPPWTALVLAPLALLPLSVAASLWLALQLAAVLAGLLALRARVLLSAPSRDGALLFGLALGFQPLWLIVAGGNLDGFLFAALALAVAAATRGHGAAAGALLGMLALKPHLFLLVAPVLILAAAERRRAAVAFAITMGTLAGASMLLMPGSLGAWLASAAALGGSEGSNATLWTIERVTPGLPRGAIAIPLAALLLTAFAVWWRRARPHLEPLVGAALCLSLLLAPHGWSYDFTLLLVSVAVILECLAHDLRGRRTSGVVALALVVGVVPWLLHLAAVARGGEELSVIVPLALFGMVVGTERRSRLGGPRHGEEEARVG